jgi:hypothetical protein
MIAAALLLTVALGQLAGDQPSTTLVAGRVVDAATGRPIPGAVIWSAGNAVAPPGASSRVRVITNAGGQFVVRGIGKGSLVLTAAKAGYVNAAPGQRRPAGSGQPIRVDGVHRITDVEIRMWRFASIGGAIVDEYGDPAVNVRVQALHRTFIAGRARFEDGPAATTDDRGVYRIAGLTPADYAVVVASTQTSVPSELMDAFFGGTPLPDVKRLQVSREMNGIGSAIAPAGSAYAMRNGSQTISMPPGSLTPATSGTVTIVYPTVYYPVAPSLSQAAVITLRSGEERIDVDMQIRPVRGVSVSGALLGPDGPVPVTAVRLTPAQDDDSKAPIDVATTMTDWAGTFAFAAVPPGQYVLRVLRVPQPAPDVEGLTRVSVTPGGSMTIASNAPGAPAGPPPVPRDATLIAAVPLPVGDTGVQDLIVQMTAAPRLSGRIEFRGTAERPTPEAIVGTRVVLNPADGTRLNGPSIAVEGAHIESNGDFLTYGVPPGRYTLDLTPISSSGGWFLESAMVEGRDIADLPIELSTKDVTGVVITFTDRPSAIAGTVSGAQGADATAIAIAFPTDEAMWTTAPRRLRTARVAEDGGFAIKALPAGEYYVAAVQEDLVGEWQDPALLRALARVARTVRLVEGEQTTVALRAAAIK